MKFNLNIKEGVDYLTLDYEGFRQMMIDRLKERLPEYTDLSETDMGVILIELLSHGLDVISYYKDRQSLECFLPSARERKNVIMHCKLFGYNLSSATPSKFVQIFRLKNTKGLSVNAKDGLIIANGVRYTDSVLRVKTKGEAGQLPIYFEVIGGLDPEGKFTPHFEIPSSNISVSKGGLDENSDYATSYTESVSSGGVYGDEIDPVTGEYLYRAVVLQGLTIPKELLGYSDGTASQKYTTSYTPALDYIASAPYNELVVRVYVTIGSEVTEWTRVENFLLASSTYKCYTYTTNEYGEGVIEFGNGISGAKPPKNAKIECTYRIGGGIDTNVGANTIVDIDTQYACIDSTFNPDTAFILGTDMESIEEAKVKAPASLRALDRAVTIRDYADVGLLLSYIKSSQSVFYDYDGVSVIRIIDKDNRVIASFEKGKSSEYNSVLPYAGMIRVWLMPLKTSKDIIDPSKVFITEDSMNEITNYYNDRRMVGQKVEINPANIRYVIPTIKITKDSNYTNETIINAVKSRLIDLLSLGRYTLGQDLIWSDIVRDLVDSSSGVTGLRSATFVQEVDNIPNRYYIAEDLPSEMGHIFALKPKDSPDNADPYPYEIKILLDGEVYE